MKKVDRPKTTLFMLMSVDGKISTGSNQARDFDADLPLIPGVEKGLGQYYKLEETTDLYSLNTGKVFAKIGFNSRKDVPAKIPVSFIVIDNKPHLTKQGIQYLLKKGRIVFIVTSNSKHPAFFIKDENLVILPFKKSIDFGSLFLTLYKKYKVKNLTIQSGGTLNAELLRGGLIDEFSIVVAPVLVGGKETPTLVDGASLISKNDLRHVKSLKLIGCNILKSSYLHLRYKLA